MVCYILLSVKGDPVNFRMVQKACFMHTVNLLLLSRIRTSDSKTDFSVSSLSVICIPSTGLARARRYLGVEGESLLLHDKPL